MNTISNKTFDEERALYGLKDTTVDNCRFDGPADGESAFKETSGLTVSNCFFNLRYPFWHCDNTVITDSEMTELCRAALWYDNGITIKSTKMNGIKALRECTDITLENVEADSPEYLWRCYGVKIRDSKILQSEYPFFQCKDLDIDNLYMKGKYSFQYVENAVIRNSELDTKDAFWHSKNITVYDSIVKGEYLGWYSENLKFVNCKIIGTQPLCYCKNLILENCEMIDTDLCFERSEVTATVKGTILSVKNPACGEITSDAIDEIIMEPEFVDPDATKFYYNTMAI
ncbi:MAG: DUF3737 family protein [Clostridia bacterium]|nr:DUF3737 family protein [Clostridia bacterium]